MALLLFKANLCAKLFCNSFINGPDKSSNKDVTLKTFSVTNYYFVDCCKQTFPLSI